MNPAPDADVNSVGQENFDWIVNTRCRIGGAQGQAAHGSSAGISLERVSERLAPTEAKTAWMEHPRMKVRRQPRKCASERARGEHMDRPSLSIGIEEEYQTIDPETRDLRSHIASEILPKAKRALHEAVKPEMHQAVIEVGTKVCHDIKEAREDIQALRREMITLASENGLLLAAASTHPFADWKLQEIYPDERYRRVVEDMQLIARANLVFGLHVHIGIEDRNTAIHIMNSMRYFLPHILALSAPIRRSGWACRRDSSPIAAKSSSASRAPAFPTHFPTGPSTRTLSHLLVKTNCIDNGKKIWWDIRPHPFFNTWKCACAISPCAWTRRWRLPR